MLFFPQTLALFGLIGKDLSAAIDDSYHIDVLVLGQSIQMILDWRDEVFEENFKLGLFVCCWHHFHNVFNFSRVPWVHNIYTRNFGFWFFWIYHSGHTVSGDEDKRKDLAVVLFRQFDNIV